MQLVWNLRSKGLKSFEKGPDGTAQENLHLIFYSRAFNIQIPTTDVVERPNIAFCRQEAELRGDLSDKNARLPPNCKRKQWRRNFVAKRCFSLPPYG